MNNKALIAIIVAILIIIGIAFAMSKNDDMTRGENMELNGNMMTNENPNDSMNNGGMMEDGSATTSGAGVNGSVNVDGTVGASLVAGQAVNVRIAQFAYTPATITVKKGTSVTWTNEDTAKHTVTGNTGGPNSALFGKGESYTYTFNTVGEFPYYCEPHPNMKGKVVVVE